MQKIKDAPKTERAKLTAILGDILSSGLLPSERPQEPNQSGAATSNAPELSDEEKFIREMEAKGLTISPVPESK